MTVEINDMIGSYKIRYTQSKWVTYFITFIKRHRLDIETYILDNTKNVKTDSLTERLYVLINSSISECQECKNKTTFINFTKGYHNFCSTKCSNANKEKKLKCVNTTYNNYGVLHHMKDSKIIEKRKQQYFSKNKVYCWQQTQIGRDILSKKMCERLSNYTFKEHFKIKHFNNNLFYQSKYELEFLKLCQKLDCIDKIKRCKSFEFPLTYKSYGNRFVPDFIFENTIIEIKSSYYLKLHGQDKFDAIKTILESLNFSYIMIIDNDFSEIKKILQND